MLHIAILLKPYLELILDGTKIVECRLTVQARPPFERIEPGERIYFKQSSGPFRGMAIADHVLCEGGLTPRRIEQIRRDYNDLICAPQEYWRQKRGSRFVTLIWLRDVQPVEYGPLIQPSQGAAWIMLEHETAWRRSAGDGSGAAADSFSVRITPGNLRNSTLYVTEVIDRFPAWVRGGATRREAAEPVTLMLGGGPTVRTDIVTPRKLLRTRIWGRWFAEHGAQPGDRVVFTPLDPQTFLVGLARRDVQGHQRELPTVTV